MIDLPTVSQWFVQQRVDDSITLVTEPHVHRLLRCNVWHVRGRDRDVVVDTALGLRPLRHLVERELDGPLLAVATHAHGDHVGGFHEFTDRAMHSAEVEWIADGGSVTLATALYDSAVTDPYRAAGYELDEYLIDAIPAGFALAPTFAIPSASPTQLLTDGDIVDLGDRAFEVLHLPGHSPGSIGLWEAATGIFFSGDAIYDGPLLDEIDGANIADYITTMERLRTLPVSVVHGGHERSFGRERLVELCDEYLAARN